MIEDAIDTVATVIAFGFALVFTAVVAYIIVAVKNFMVGLIKWIRSAYANDP